MKEEERSHEDYIKQGISDYETTFYDWELELLIEQIIILSEMKSRIDKLIHEMKQHMVNTFEEVKKE